MKNGKIVRSFLASVLATVTVLGAPVSTTAVSAGDVNGDGKINLGDASLVLKSVAKWDDVKMNTEAADVTGDGKVNLADVSLLMKHIAGWNDLAPLPELGPVLDLEGVTPINYRDLEYDDSYSIASREWLQSYFDEPLDTFYGVCKYQEENGFELYNYDVKNGNHFATYTKGSDLLHFYWIECESELNVVYSRNSGKLLPPKDPYVPADAQKISVTQLQSSKYNGMGYAVRLADGSFILYDGGYSGSEDEMWNTLTSLNGGEENIIIRAWVITHTHIDHYEGFAGFAEKYADKVTLERLLISPVRSEDTGGDTYLNDGVIDDVARFEGASILYAHTGMTLPFAGAKLEVLFAPEELYISDARWGSGLVNLIDSNSSSMVTRVYTDNYSAIFLGDATNHVANRMIIYYGDYLRSDMCQAAHHGWESWPLIAYRHIQASVMWYPTSQECYDYTGKEDVYDIREAIRNSPYTKEIIVHEHARETRYFE